MKTIEICAKIAPFSHMSGTQCLVPLSNWRVTAYPALLRLSNSLDIPIGVIGPVEQFLVQMDLERDCIWVSGIAQQGHYRFRIKATKEGLFLTLDRAPKEGMMIGSMRLKSKEKTLLASGGITIDRNEIERISFGNWKSQDWDLVRRRNDPREILPALYLLGQKIPSEQMKGGSAALLLEKASWKSFFLAGFSGILVPNLKDLLFQGIGAEEEGTGDPNGLLSMAYLSIRRCLIQRDAQIRILPDLPKDWIAGRALGIKVAGLGHIDFEWTKGLIRRVVVHAEQDSEVQFSFSQEIQIFRSDGKRVQNGDFLSLKSGKTLLDRFQK